MSPVLRTVRRAWRATRVFCYNLQADRRFEYTTLAVIIVNAIVLGLVWYEMPKSVEQFTMYCNYAFTVFFGIEMLIKLVGMGPYIYVLDPFNDFDGAITVVGIIDMALTLAPGVNGLGGATSAFRALRLLRVFRLVSRRQPGARGVCLVNR